jgi:hypothetical protein
MASKPDFDVFINCPFDNEYKALFEAILFAVYLCGFRPRCSKEEDDGGNVRIEKINRIIRECRIGIHDISRTELDSANNLPRFNMPFELGLFLGAKEHGGKNQKNKICIIFDKEDFRYQKYISDIGGQDIKSHAGDASIIISNIRNALNAAPIPEKPPIAGAAKIISQYKLYQIDKPGILETLNLQPDEITYADETAIIQRWIEKTISL